MCYIDCGESIECVEIRLNEGKDITSEFGEKS